MGLPAESQPTLQAAWNESGRSLYEMNPNVTITGSDYAYTPDSFAALVAGIQVPTLFQFY